MENTTLNKVFDNMASGVLILNSKGKVEYANAASHSILGIQSDILLHSTFPDFLINNISHDPFSELLLNAIYEKECVLEGIVAFYPHDNQLTADNCKYIEVKTSYISESNNTYKMIILLNDVTERELANQNRLQTSKIFALFFSVVTIYAFMYSFISSFSFAQIDSRTFSQIAEIIVLIVTIIFFKQTTGSLSKSGMKLSNLKQGIVKGVLYSSVILLGLFLLKYMIIWLFPNFIPVNTPFFKTERFILGGISFAHLIYPITTLVQEFITRVVTQESIQKVFIVQGQKNAGFFAVLLSSLIFATLHLHKGFFFMLGSFVISLILGIIYKKTNNYWLVVVIHLLVGDIGVSLLP